MSSTTCPDCDGHGETRSLRMSPEADCDLDTCRTCGGSGEIDPDEAREALLESDTPIGLNDDDGCDERYDIDSDAGYDPYTGGCEDQGYDTGCDDF